MHDINHLTLANKSLSYFHLRGDIRTPPTTPSSSFDFCDFLPLETIPRALLTFTLKKKKRKCTEHDKKGLYSVEIMIVLKQMHILFYILILIFYSKKEYAKSSTACYSCVSE